MARRLLPRAVGRRTVNCVLVVRSSTRRGRIVKVVKVHAPALASLRVSFSDHSSIVVHPNHEWTVYDRGSTSIRTIETKAMQRVRLDTGAPGRGHRYRFLLPQREALTLPEAELLIEPYTLGVWLGDGSTTKPAITHHPADTYALAYSVSSTAIHNETGIHTDYYSGQMIKAYVKYIELVQ